MRPPPSKSFSRKKRAPTAQEDRKTGIFDVNFGKGRACFSLALVVAGLAGERATLANLQGASMHRERPPFFPFVLDRRGSTPCRQFVAVPHETSHKKKMEKMKTLFLLYTVVHILKKVFLQAKKRGTRARAASWERARRWDDCVPFGHARHWPRVLRRECRPRRPRGRDACCFRGAHHRYSAKSTSVSVSNAATIPS